MTLHPLQKTALKWGAYIGLANLIWLYVARYLGLHTSGIMVFQGFMLVWLILTVAGYIRAMVILTGMAPDGLTFLQGLNLGALAAAVSAAISVIAQIGYYKIVHPEWPQVMAAQAREHFERSGLAPADVEAYAAAATKSFTLQNYAMQSAIYAFVMGMAISAMAMFLLRKRPA